MTISSRQIFKAITHYQKNNGVKETQEHMLTERLIEAMRTGESNDYVVVDEISGLGKGFFVKGHGTYFPNDMGSVTFVQSV
tara:strand:+ start:416 stop:658 length:243 start_codon:yes stop_codon:yes gene_type:complete